MAMHYLECIAISFGKPNTNCENSSYNEEINLNSISFNKLLFSKEISEMNILSANELTTLAYRKVKEMILSDELKPGQKIVQDKLALDLGISRTPLRSALQILEAEHLVQSIPRRGVIVRKISDQKIVEIYDCRIALECMAVRNFIEIATEKQILKFQKFFKNFDTEKPFDSKTYQEEDIKFHNYIIENCGNEFLTRLFQQGNLVLCISQIGLIRPPSETLLEHRAIIQAIGDRDIPKAVALAEDHLEKSKFLVMEKIERESLRKQNG